MTANKSSAQILPQEYHDLDYLDKPRWISFWYQIHEVVETHSRSVLEIGVGNGLVGHVLRMLNIKVTTVDLDRRLKPDVVADIRRLPFRANSFDTLLCAQVLEHLPYAEFPMALKELGRVVKKNAVITLPHDFLTYFLIHFKIFPYVRPLTFFKAVSSNQTHRFNGQHYWEIGKKGYSLQKILNLMHAAGFKVIKTYCLPENPYHRFFILRKAN